MSLPQFQLTEPLVSAMVSLLSSSLNATIDTLNSTVTDGFIVDHVVQFKPFIPVPSTLQGGMPAVGVQRLGSTFPEDRQSTTDGLHTYAVAAIIENNDHEALNWQLERTMQAIINTIQADRLQTTGTTPSGVLRTQGGAYSVNFIRIEPGPLLGDLDPTSLEGPPRTFLSWVALILESMRTEA